MLKTRLKFPGFIARLLPSAEQRAAQQTFWLSATTGIQILGSAVGMAFSARALGVEGFGVLALIMVVTTLVGGLIYLPGNEAITTYVTRSLARGQREEAAATLHFALGGAVATLWFSYAVIAGLALGGGHWVGIADVHIVALLIYATVNIVQAGHEECLAVLRLADRVPLATAALAAGTLVKVGMLAMAWWTDGGLLMVVVAYVVGATVYGVTMFLAAVVAARRIGLPLTLRQFTFRVPRDVGRFQMASFFKGSLRAIYLNLDILLVAQFVNAAQLGLYRGARLLVDIGLRAFPPLAISAQTECSRYWYAKDHAALSQLLGRFSLFALVLATVGYGTLAIFCQPIVRLVLGPDFAGVVDPLLIMIPGAFLFASSMVLHILPAATGRAWPLTLAELTALVVQVIVLYVLAPRYGTSGAAWAYTAYALVFVVITLPFAAAVLRRSALRQA